MKLRSLSALKRAEPAETFIGKLPQSVMITKYAWQRALAVNELVRRIHGDSFEWYGFTLGGTDYPECITDIGLPVNDQNVHQYTGIGPENISRFQESLPGNTLINGWIHSHGQISMRSFSSTDQANHLTVLDYVGSFLKKPITRKEVLVDDLMLISEENPEDDALGRGSVWIETDRPISRARIFERVLGSFCYAVLVGDGGWHVQEIYYRTRAILTGGTSLEGRRADLLVVESGREFTKRDEEVLAAEISERISPDRRTIRDAAETARE